MALRQRTSQTTVDRTTPETSEEPPNMAEPHSHVLTHQAASSSAVASPSPSVGSSRKSIRLNRVLGRIVPLILLIYLSYTYDLVVLRYGYRYLYLHQRRSALPIAWLLPTHGIFFFSLRTYLRVFFAHSHPSSSTILRRKGFFSWLRSKLGATFPCPDTAQQRELKRINQYASFLLTSSSGISEIHVELCQVNGEPLRCYRDDCKGRIKAFRTRHCGDCGTCRVGFDHHCAWFDNDVASPSTLRSFIGFLLSVPPLLSLALGPIIPSAARTLRRILTFASSDASIQETWWSRRYSWIGGPAFRYMVGFVLGAKRWSDTTGDRMPHESPRAPLIVLFGGLFVFVACGLAISSLTNLRTGMLTIDVERAKAYKRLARQRHKLELAPEENKDKLTAVKAKMAGLAPMQYLKITTKDGGTGEAKERIVSVSVEEGLLTHGSTWTNLRQFLGAEDPASPAWSIPDSTLRSALRKASIIPPD